MGGAVGDCVSTPTLYTASMLTHAHRPQWVAPTITVALVAILAGSFLWLNAQPEYRRVKSTDGVVTVEGLFPSNISVGITEDKGASSAPWTAVVGRVYVVEPDDVLLPTPATITFCQSCEDGLNQDLVFQDTYTPVVIGYYDTERGMWIPVASDRSEDTLAISAQTTHFSHWALLYQHGLVSTQDSASLITDALDAAPPNANSYSIDLAYSIVEGDFVLMEEGAKSDRCAETSVGRAQRVTTTTDRPATIYVKNEARAATLRAVIHWETGSPCPDLLQ